MYDLQIHVVSPMFACEDCDGSSTLPELLGFASRSKKNPSILGRLAASGSKASGSSSANGNNDEDEEGEDVTGHFTNLSNVEARPSKGKVNILEQTISSHPDGCLPSVVVDLFRRASVSQAGETLCGVLLGRQVLDRSHAQRFVYYLCRVRFRFSNAFSVLKDTPH
jgi:hypothetical protein